MASEAPGGLASENGAVPDDAAPDDGFESLPPVSLLFLLAGAVRNLLLTLVALLTFSGGRPTGFVITLGIFMLPALLGAALRYLSFRFRFADDELHIREGILQRNERHVPYARIQNVDLVQNPVHRWLDVATVRLETASGGRPEASISVLPLDVVEDLRRRVFRQRGATRHGADGELGDEATRRSDDVHAADGHELARVPASELALLGLLSNKGMLVVAAAFGLLQQFGVFDDTERLEAWLGRLPALQSYFESIDPRAWTPWQIGLAFAAFVAVFTIITRLLSAAWMLFTLWDFRLGRHGDDLRTGYGLLTRITATIPRRRVQLLSFRESFLQERLRRASMQVETAGGGQAQGDEQGPGASRLWLAPMTPRSEVDRLTHEVLPTLELDAVEWRPIARRARSRLVRKGLVFVAVVTLLGTFTLAFWGLERWGLLGLALVPAVVVHATRFTRRTGWAITGDTVLFRSGAWGRQTSAVPFAKVQCVEIAQSLFDRRWGMARVRVDTAGAKLGGHRVDIPYLDTVNAHALARILAVEASRRTFRW